MTAPPVPCREADPTPPPWYRQMWPWLLMLMPATALVGGVITYWLAAHSNNALVTDDYYKEGKAINLDLARDRFARDSRLVAEIAPAPAAAGGETAVQLRLRAADGFAFPDRLRLRLMHATRAELDREATLTHLGAGLYRQDGVALPAEGRWRIQIDEVQGRWRLVGTANGFGGPVRIDAAR